jgi:hypothetical protein
MAKTEQQTFYNLRVTTADGRVDTQEYKSEKQKQEIEAEAAKASSTVEVLKQQTFIVTTAENFDDILNVVPNKDVACGYLNYGLTLAQHNVKRELMKDPEWAEVEGAYNLIDDVQEARERRVPDPLNASRKSLKALWAKMHPGAEPPTDDEINAVLASFAGAAAPAPVGA